MGRENPDEGAAGGADGDGDKTDDDGNARSVDDPRQDVASQFVGAQEMVCSGPLKHHENVEFEGIVWGDDGGKGGSQEHQRHHRQGHGDESVAPPVHPPDHEPCPVRTWRGSITWAARSTMRLTTRTMTVTVMAAARSTG